MSKEPDSTSGNGQPPDNSLNKKLPEKNNQENPLTCIRCEYTLAYTEDGSELDKVIVKNFVEVLANIALSIAARKT
jgi:predicted nucleic-acid-binding Zn-ribbon protein